MNLKTIHKLASNFQRCRRVKELASFLKTPVYGLKYLSENKYYNEFTARKSSGGKRLIEDPEPVLKDLLSSLSDGFQAVHYLERPAAAYGFQWCVKNEKEPRNIKTNAKQHIGKRYLVNLDFQNFFHQINKNQLHNLLSAAPFQFDEDCKEIIINLASHKGRLPMGSPCSPVLSNLAVQGLDHDLEEFCSQNQITYTRFVDDLSFSSQNPITDDNIATIKNLTRVHNLTFNDSKMKVYGPDDIKIVTGLEIAASVTIPQKFLHQLSVEIQKYCHTKEVNQVVGYTNEKYLEKLKSQLEGKLRYVGFILGENSDTYNVLLQQYHKSEEPLEFDNISWLDFDYQKFIPAK